LFNTGNKSDKKAAPKKETDNWNGDGTVVEKPPSTQEIIERAKREQGTDAGDGKTKHDVTLIMWSNGFQVGDDGEFRPYTDPANQAFMAELKEGKVPAELRQKYPGGLGVALNDKREEEYVPPPPPKYISFSGDGTNMGEEIKSTGGAVNTAATGGKPVVDDSKPKTQIQFRFHNG